VLAQGVFYATRSSDDLLRPPGAQDEKDFLARCVRCGRCIQACPYVCLRAVNDMSGAAVGTPALDVRNQACRLCEDFPCTNACPTGALRDIEDRTDVNMGLAVIDTELCIAMQGMRCEVCYRVCPLIDTAITIDYRLREGDSTHAIFAPVVDEEACVGCGLCVERCVIDDPAVAITVIRDRDRAIEETRKQQAALPAASGGQAAVGG